MEKEVKKYVCVCGREFDNPQAFNGHKATCKQHYIFKYGSIDKYLEVRKEIKEKGTATQKQKALQKKAMQIENWISEKHICENCGKVMTEKYGSGRFCSKSCANTRKQSEETKTKIKDTLLSTTSREKNKNHLKSQELETDYSMNPNYCIICGKELSYNDRYKKTCGSIECRKECASIAGRKSVLRQGNNKRSKSEIYFYDLCCQYFNDVEHNKPMFEDWDADIIINDIKYAILWNGPFHYIEMFSHPTLEKTQERDARKIEAILRCGYTPYIIKQLTTFDKIFIEQEFKKFIDHINNN